jgi:hypothetical protein
MTTAIGFALAALSPVAERQEVPWGSLGLSLSAGLFGAAVVAVLLRRRPGVARIRRTLSRRL